MMSEPSDRAIQIAKAVYIWHHGPYSRGRIRTLAEVISESGVAELEKTVASHASALNEWLKKVAELESELAAAEREQKDDLDTLRNFVGDMDCKHPIGRVIGRCERAERERDEWKEKWEKCNDR